MKKLLFLTALLFTGINNLFGIEWPQEEIDSSSIVSYFGQNIGGQLSTSIIFADPAEVKAIQDGKILIVMSDISEDCDFFPSTLGNSIILAHDDDLISVYGNLDKDSLNDSVKNKTSLKEGQKIAETGNSGWQQKRSNLEFQIIDTQKSIAINPKILLPRTENEIDLTLTNIVLQNKNGDFFNIKEQKTFPSGLYRVYQSRNKTAVPYKTTVTINGVIVDQISYDTISQENGKTYVVGKKKYISTDIYPDEELLLLGETMLTPGKSTLGLSVDNFLGKQKQITYSITIN